MHAIPCTSGDCLNFVSFVPDHDPCNTAIGISVLCNLVQYKTADRIFIIKIGQKLRYHEYMYI